MCGAGFADRVSGSAMGAGRRTRRRTVANQANSGAGRYTTLFTNIGARDLQVDGLPPGSAGAGGIPSRILSMSSDGVAVGHDTLRVLEALMVAPAGPLVSAAEANARSAAPLAAE